MRDVPRFRSSSGERPTPRYFFHTHDNTDFLDNDRTVLPDAAIVHAQAVSTAGSILRDIGDAFWSGAEWHMIVIDEAATANGERRAAVLDVSGLLVRLAVPLSHTCCRELGCSKRNIAHYAWDYE